MKQYGIVKFFSSGINLLAGYFAPKCDQCKKKSIELVCWHPEDKHELLCPACTEKRLTEMKTLKEN
jgi:DNA-directed RNA polymerase subunit RPC12/RpoP